MLFHEAGIPVLEQVFEYPVYRQQGSESVPNLAAPELLFACGRDAAHLISATGGFVPQSDSPGPTPPRSPGRRGTLQEGRSRPGSLPRVSVRLRVPRGCDVSWSRARSRPSQHVEQYIENDGRYGVGDRPPRVIGDDMEADAHHRVEQGDRERTGFPHLLRDRNSGSAVGPLDRSHRLQHDQQARDDHEEDDPADELPDVASPVENRGKRRGVSRVPAPRPRPRRALDDREQHRREKRDRHPGLDCP